MEELLALQLAFLAAILVANLVCLFLPVKLFSAGNKASCNTSDKTQRVIDLCNSLSAGVFLGTCYIQLIPYVESKFRDVFASAELSQSYSGVTAQCVIMAGFFMILIVEQCVHACQRADHKHGPEPHVQLNGAVVSATDGYDASSDSSDSIDLDTDDPKQTMLSKSKTSTSGGRNTVTFTHNHSHTHADSHSHHGGGGGGHGHSHVIDMTRDSSSSLRCVLLLAALSCHSLFEGVAVGLQDSVPRLVNLYIGVLIHEALVAFAIGVSLARQSLRRSLVLQLGLVFSLMIPVGMAIGLGIGEAHGVRAEAVSAVLQGVAAGTFVYVVFLEVIPAEINAARDKALRILLLFIGFALILCLALGLHDD